MAHRFVDGAAKVSRTSQVMRSVAAVRYTDLVLVPANGYLGPLYEPFLDELAPRLGVKRVHVLDWYPSMKAAVDAGQDDSWGPAVDFIREEHRKIVRPSIESELRSVVTVGHSAGGTLMAAAQRRGCGVNKLVLVDPPMFGWKTRALIAASLQLRAGPFVKFIAKVRGRRNLWASREEAMEHLARSYPLNSFSPLIHSRFAEHCLEECEGGVRLVFDPNVEARMFELTPTEILDCITPMSPLRLYNNRLTQPVLDDVLHPFGGLLYLSKKREFHTEADQNFLRATFQRMRASFVDDHFAPLSDPFPLARDIAAYFSESNREGRSIAPWREGSSPYTLGG